MRASQAVVVALLGLAGCGRAAPETLTDRTEIQRLARITIPPSATALQCRAEYGKDALYYGRFDIPAADLQVLVDSMPKGVPIESDTRYSSVTLHKLSEPWWQPGQLREPRMIEWSQPGFSANLLFGESGKPGLLTVYFFNCTK